MPSPTIHLQRNAAERTSLGGLDFVLRTAIQPYEKDQIDGFIRAFDVFYKPSS